MSSFRGGTGLPARPSEGRAQRLAEAASSGRGIPRPVPSYGRGDAHKADHKPSSTRIASATSSSTSHSRLPSRVAQATSGRQPSSSRLPQQEPPKPSLIHQPTSWGSDTTAPSSRTNSHTQSGSGSSTSSKSYDASQRSAKNVIRRKSTTVARPAGPSYDKSPPTATPSSLPQPKGYFDRPFGIHMDTGLTASPADTPDNGPVESVQTLSQSPIIYPELDRYRNYQRPDAASHEQQIELLYKLSTQDLPPPTPASLLFSGSSSQLSASPSTKFSGSPGPGPYSRDTTPTSMSSQSPGLSAPTRLVIPKGRQLSPAITRPPVTRRRAGSTPNDTDLIDPQGLAAVRESLTSSSSSSTVKEAERSTKDRKTSSRLAPPPPSPPPRKSSQKFRKIRDEESKPVPKLTPRSTSSSRVPSPQKSTASSTRSPTSPASPTRPGAPRRPSRDGAPNIDSQLLGPTPVIHSNLSTTSLPGERRAAEAKDVPIAYQHGKNASTSQLPAGFFLLQDPELSVLLQQSPRLRLQDPEGCALYLYYYDRA